MTTGVAMAAYNGRQFIEQQLDSLRAQTLLPDRVAIRDDGSRDGTQELVRAYIEKYGLAQTYLFAQNPRRLGYIQNFYAVMDDLDTDVIFLCDQDDVWRESKVLAMARVLEEHPEIDVLSCAHELMDDAGRPQKTIRYETFEETGAVSRVGADRLVRSYAFPGMCLAVRRDFYRRVRRVALSIDTPHDRTLCLLAEKENGMFFYDQVGASHRMHAGNAGGEKNRARDYLRRAGRIDDLVRMLDWLSALRARDDALSGEACNAIDRYRAALTLRLDGLRRGTPLPGLRAMRSYPAEVPAKSLLADGVSLLFGRGASGNG